MMTRNNKLIAIILLTGMMIATTGCGSRYLTNRYYDFRDTFALGAGVTAENAFTGVYRIFLKVGSPEFIISKASRMFGNYFQNLPDETFRVLGSSSKSAHIAMDRFTGGHPDFCRRLDGYFERLVELSGGKNVRLAHILCAFNTSPPGDHCEWKGYWE